MKDIVIWCAILMVAGMAAEYFGRKYFIMSGSPEMDYFPVFAFIGFLSGVVGLGTILVAIIKLVWGSM